MATAPVPSQAVLSPQVRVSRYFFHDVSLAARSGVLPAYGGWEQCRPDFRVQRDGFPWGTLEWVVAGRGTAVLNGRSDALGPGSLFRYDRRTRCEIRADPGAPLEKYFLCLTGEQVRERLDRLGLLEGELTLVPPGEEARLGWDDLIATLRRGGPVAERLAPAMTEVLLLKLEALRLGGGEGGMSEREFGRVKGLVDGAAPTLHRLADLCRLTGLGVTRLSRLFRRHEGVGPAQYLLRRKMHLAAEALLGGRERVKEIAARLGFADPYHFSRCFKRVHGVSPRAFARLGEAGVDG